MASYLQQEFKPASSLGDTATAIFEFKSPRTVGLKSDQISPSRSIWDSYSKRKEIEEKHETDFYAIMKSMAQDGYVKTAVSKYVNSIFLRGYTIHSLKKSLVEYLRLRLRFISEATGENTDALFQRIAHDLVAYANVYVQKIRRPQPASQLPKRLKAIKGVPFMKSGKLQHQDPIAGYDLIHPATMHVFRDRFGNIIRYEQWPMWAKSRPNDDKQIRKFTPEEIIHIVVDREDNFAYGTPFLAAVIDDIRMLRLIEDHTSRLAFRYAFPFTQVRVGDTKPGFQATEEDLIFYRKLIAEAPPDATLVTNEKVKFEVVGAQGTALNMAPYLEHFENRAFTGLQVPAVSMGRGETANRSTADAMTTEMHDQIKHFQNVIARAISDEIYQELLREAGYSIYDDEKNWCAMLFEEIEVESKIKRETHVLQKLQANAITFSEARVEMGYQPMTDSQWSDTYLVKFLLPQIMVKDTGLADLDEHGKLKLEQHKHGILATKADIDLTKAQTDKTKADAELTRKTEPQNAQPEGPHQTTTTTHVQSRGKDGSTTRKKTVQVKKPVGAPKGHFPPAASGAGRPSSPSAGVSKGVGNKTRPANQHGKRSGPKRSTEALEVSEAIASRNVDLMTGLARYHAAMMELYSDLRGAAIEQGAAFMADPHQDEPKLAELLFNLVEDRLVSLSRTYLMPAFREGVRVFNEEAEQSISDVWLNERKALEIYNERTMARLIRDVCRPSLSAIKKATNEAKLTEKINAIFEAQSYRLGFIANTEIPQSFWFGYASAAYLADIDLDIVAEEDACESCIDRDGFEHSSSATVRLKRVPTLHPNCDCSLEICRGDAQTDDEDQAQT